MMIIGPMHNACHFTMMSLEQAENSYHKVVTKLLTYFTMSQFFFLERSASHIVKC